MQTLCGIKRSNDTLNLDIPTPKIRRINSGQTMKALSFSFQPQSHPLESLSQRRHVEKIEELFQKAIDLQKCKRFQSATLAYQRILKEIPNHIGALDGIKRAIHQHTRRLHAKVDYLISEKEWAAARLKCQKILDHYPKSKIALRKYECCQLQQQVVKDPQSAKQPHPNNRWNRGLNYYSLCLDHKPLSIVCLEKKARCLRKLGRISEAWMCYQQVLEIEPRHTVALKKQIKYFNLLSLELSACELMNDWQSIEKKCKEILIIRPQTPNILWKWLDAKKMALSSIKGR